MGFTKRMSATVASIVSAARSAGTTMLPKAKIATPFPSLFVTPSPIGMGSSSFGNKAPGPAPRG